MIPEMQEGFIPEYENPDVDTSEPNLEKQIRDLRTELQQQLNERDITIMEKNVIIDYQERENTRLTAEVERLTRERDTQYDETCEQIRKVSAVESERDALRETLRLVEEWKAYNDCISVDDVECDSEVDAEQWSKLAALLAKAKGAE